MELFLQYLALGKLFIATLFALCYGLGGMLKKWIRRFLAPLGIYLPAVAFLSDYHHYNLATIISPFLLCGALHMGYSDNEGHGKIKRLIAGLAIALSALPIAIVTGKWLLFSIHSVFCVGLMYSLGVYNPMQNARDEETLLGFMFVVIPIFMV